MIRSNKRGQKSKRRVRGRFRASQSEACPDGPGNVRVPRVMPLPTTMTVTLNYDDRVIVRTNAGTQTVGWRYRMNSAFDPDVNLGTGAVPGFLEYASLFIAYRVIHFRWQISLANDELFPMTTYVVPLNEDPGANPSNGLTLAANAKGVIRPLSAIGGPPARFFGSVNLANFFGLRGYDFDDDFNAPTNSNPSVPLLLLVGAQTPSVLTASGIVATIRLTYTTVFNRRRNLAA
jgi:hypothetical protein